MSSPFVAEIRIVPFNFAPTGWAMCQGQIMPISQNTALFSLLGTFYGGDGKSTFALPNFQGSVAIHHGQGPGLTDRIIGEVGGSENVTLISTEIPSHSHVLNGDSSAATSQSPTNNLPGALPGGRFPQKDYSSAAPAVTMAVNTVLPTGGNLPHNNMMPYLALNYVIALQGIFPSRS
jgi:microcystin-dependent protein